MLKVSHICKTFTGGIIRKTRVNAVKDVSFTIRDGETFGIVGNSGCGKSTIANMLLSLIKPDSGHHRDRRDDPDHLPAPGNILRSGQKDRLQFGRADDHP